MVDTISLDTMSVSSFGDEEEEEDTVSLYSAPGEREAGFVLQTTAFHNSAFCLISIHHGINIFVAISHASTIVYQIFIEIPNQLNPPL